MTAWTKRGGLFAALLLAGRPAPAQLLSYEDLTGSEDTAGTEAPSQQPRAGASTEPAAQAETGGAKLQYALLDRLEWAPKGDSYAWDFSLLYGDDSDRVYFGTSGDGTFTDGLDYLELNAFYSRNVGGNWDLNAGLRYDALPHPNRVYGVLGTQYDDGKLWVGAWAYLSTKGEVSARLAAYYNLQLAKRLFLQPSFELDAYAKDIPALGIGRGFSYAEAGLRMRYQLLEHLAPYVGFSWSRDLGRTARLDRAAGEDPESQGVVLGVRSEF